MLANRVECGWGMFRRVKYLLQLGEENMWENIK